MPTFPGHTTVRETLVSYGSSRPGQLPVVRSRQFLPDHRLTVALPLDAPSLQPHYKAFLTTTSDSAPVLRLGTLAGAACLTGSLHIGATGSHVPYGSQDHSHATSMPDAGIIGHPPTLSQERDPLLVSTSPENVSTRHQGFAHARLRDPHLAGIFSPNAHDNGF